jgi:hypothetical protein
VQGGHPGGQRPPGRRVVQVGDGSAVQVETVGGDARLVDGDDGQRARPAGRLGDRDRDALLDEPLAQQPAEPVAREAAEKGRRHAEPGHGPRRVVRSAAQVSADLTVGSGD